MNQGTKDWHEWRRQGLGASDAPVVMGESPYLTPYQLWEQKVFGADAESSSYITQLGHKFEPMMRADVELDIGHSITPQCVEHKALPWLRASLDGFNEEKRVFCEIKYVGKDKMQAAQKGEIPLDHWIQMQHQFMVTGFDRGIYACYTLNDDKSAISDTALVRISKDVDYITSTLFPALELFWEGVKKQKPPALADKDTRKVTSPEALSLAEKYVELEAKQKEVEAQLKKIKAEILAHQCGSAITEIGQVKIQTITRKGNVDYSKIPELKNVDTDKYRKPSSKYQKICISGHTNNKQ